MLAGMAQATRQQSVSAHGEHHACQAEQQHHDHGGHADDDAQHEADAVVGFDEFHFFLLFPFAVFASESL